jgi:hypothetical protein
MTATKREEAAKKHPDSWIPLKEGEELTGTVVDVDKGWSDARANGNGGDGWYPLLTVKTANGNSIKWHAFETVAANEILKRRPMSGELITATYMGESENSVKGQNPAKLFRLRVHGRDPATEAANIYDSFGGRGASQRSRRPQPPAPIVGTDMTADDDIPY